jgi:hypothetical protein
MEGSNASVEIEDFLWEVHQVRFENHPIELQGAEQSPVLSPHLPERKIWKTSWKELVCIKHILFQEVSFCLALPQNSG